MSKPSIKRLHELFFIPDDGRLFRKITRSSEVGQCSVGSVDENGYIATSVDHKTIRVHIIVFAMIHGRWPISEIDHIDGNKSNNAPHNLREATTAQNGWNRGKQKNNKSGYKGVMWNKQRRKWMATIMVNRKNHYLGLFDDPEMASYAYQSASLKLHGEFAKS